MLSRDPSVLRLRAGALLALVVLVSFGPGVLGGFVWDDHVLIANNPRLRDASQLPALLTQGLFEGTEHQLGARYYRPVVAIAYFVQFQAFGMHPLGYHVVSVLLHLACVLLAFAWLERRFRAQPGEHAESLASDPSVELPLRALLAALAGALVFALHPTRSESVTLIAGCTDLYMTLFALLAVLLAARATHPASLAAVFLCTLLACSSKETAVVLPVLFVIDQALLGTRIDRRPVLAMLAGVLVTLAARTLAVGSPVSSASSILWGLPQRVLSSLGHYAHAIAWPFSPTVLRGKMEVAADGTFLVETLSVVVGVSCLLALGWLALRARSQPALRAWLADLSWVVLPLVPVVNLLPLKLPALVADRFLYLPALGLGALVARAVISASVTLAMPVRVAASALFVVWLVASASVVSSHGRALASDQSLWQYELERDRGRPYVLERAIATATLRGDHRSALELALEGHTRVRGRGLASSEASFLISALGALSRTTPDIEQDRLRTLEGFYAALRAGQRAELELPPLRLPGREPIAAVSLRVKLSEPQRALFERELAGFALVHAELLARTRRVPASLAMIEALARKHPQNPDVLAALAIAQARLGRLEPARASVRSGLSNAPAHRALFAAQRAIDAVSTVRSATPADPLAASLLYAQIDVILGLRAEARDKLDRLIAEHPRDPGVHALRIRLDAIDKRPDLARERLDRVKRELPEPAALWASLEAELDAIREIESQSASVERQ